MYVYARAKSVAAVCAVTALVLSGFALLWAPPASADIDPAPGTPATVTADGLPTWQINGVVWSQVIVGNTVYVAGNFTKARPPKVAAGGAGEVDANNIFAYDLTTGNRVASFDHQLNGQAYVVSKSPDGSQVYVGGDFTTVDGVARSHIAAFNTSDNTLNSSFAPRVSSKVAAIAATNSTVWFGGNFYSVSGSARNRLAAANASDGALLPWAPTADDNEVEAMVLTPDQSRVIVGGAFTTLNGTAASGMGSLDATSGAVMPWAANQIAKNGGAKSGITSLRTDGTNIYGSGFAFGTGNFEGTFSANPNDGTLNMINDCHGDTYDVYPQSGVLYTVSHVHDCSAIGGQPQINSDVMINKRPAMAFTTAPGGVNTGPDSYGWNYNGLPASSILQWYPRLGLGSFTGASQAAWSLTGNSDYVVAGGEFPTVNGLAQQGLTRFAKTNLAPNKRGPSVLTAYGAPNPQIVAPSATSVSAGRARVSWQAAFDQDNETLTYEVYRDGGTTPVYTTTQKSNFWIYPTMGFVDSGLTPGQTYTYTIKAKDSSGNTLTIGTPSATVSTTAATAYSSDVINDGAAAYWRLGESSGSTVYDYAGFNDAIAGNGVSRGVNGAINGDADKASGFNGSSNGSVSSPTMTPSSEFTIETWIKTSTSRGGKIVGFGSSATGNSGSYDRHVYMDNSGRIFFGVYPGAVKTVNSGSRTYNDNSWHHIVATQSGTTGITLYVDGLKVGSDTSVTSAQIYKGFWRIGGDSLSSWPNQPTSNYFSGSIDDTAIYPTALPVAKIRQHFTDSGRSMGGPAVPTDTYGKKVYDDAPDLYWRVGEASGTTASDYSGNRADGSYFGSYTQGQAGAIPGLSDKAVKFNGNTGGVSSNSTTTNPTTYSEELWFKTTTTRGGKLIGFGDARTGNSSNYDRHVYMQNSGQLTFGVYVGGQVNVTSPKSYNDGLWHHMVATQSSDGMKLYVDGQVVGTNPQTQAQSFTGYWRVGGDSSWAADNYFNGTIDEVAVYSKALAAKTVAGHYLAGGGTLPNQLPTAAFTSTVSGRTATFDGTGSNDPDGNLVSYQWDFGDGSNTSGATPDHTYTKPGTYAVALTVTDDRGGSNTVTKSVTITNVGPKAAFRHSEDLLTTSVDASDSADADGTVDSYDWDWGDGSAVDHGKTATHTYASGGTYTVKLTVTDNDGSTDTVSQDVVVVANQAPKAAFTSSVTDFKASVDGSTSSDADGTVASYSWDWGDGTPTSSGATATHTYAKPGSYDVRLTVTDNRGDTDTATRTLTVTAPPAGQPLATDSFERTTATGWGPADLGGTWTTKNAAANFAVGSGVGSIKMATAGATSTIMLNGVSSPATNVTASLSLRKLTTGGGVYGTLIGREVAAGGGYRATLNFRPDGRIILNVVRRTATGTETSVAPGAYVPGLTYAANDKINVRLVVSGTSPTTVKARVWKAGTTEPTTWLVNTTDNTDALQAAGTVGLAGYLSSSSTDAPSYLDVDDLSAVTAD